MLYGGEAGYRHLWQTEAARRLLAQGVAWAQFAEGVDGFSSGRRRLSRITIWMTPILGCLSVAAILVVISEMLWFNRRLHALEPLRRRSMHFLRLIGDDRVSNAMCATKEQAGLYLFGTAMQAAETPPLPAAHLVLVTYPA